MRNITLDDIIYTLYADHAVAAKFIDQSNETDSVKVAIREYVHGLPVTEIGKEAFIRANIQEVHIPKTVETIGKAAFFNAKLTKATGCQGLKNIGDEAFDSSQLKEFDFHEGLLHIGACAFDTIEFRMECIKLPESLLTFDLSAFRGNSSESITAHGSTEIICNNVSALNVDSAHPRFIIEPPFTKTISEGNLIMSSDRTKVCTISNPNLHLHTLSIPGSVREMLPLCINIDITSNIIFEYSDTPLEAHVSDLEYVSIETHRPLDLHIKYLSDTLKELDCYAPVTLWFDDSNLIFEKITCHPGGSINVIKSDDIDDEEDDEGIFLYNLNVIYQGEHPYVPIIHYGKTLIPESTVKIGTVKAFRPRDYDSMKDTMNSHCITFRCTTPPQIEKVERGALQPLTLIVPKGCVPAYSAHKQWGRCEIITDGFGATIDRSKSQFSTANKREMLTTLARKFAEKLAEATFPEYYYSLEDMDDCSTIDIELPTGNPRHPSVTFTRIIPIDSLGTPDTWDQLRAEVNQITNFLSQK